jgi:hypothetical protein
MKEELSIAAYHQSMGGEKNIPVPKQHVMKADRGMEIKFHTC